MINPDRINNEENSYKLPSEQENSAGEMLPLEVLDKIFSQLENSSVESTALTSRFYSQASVYAVKTKELIAIKHFARTLAENLDENLYANERKELLLIGEAKVPEFTKLLEARNLNAVKLSIVQIRERVLDILQTLKVEDLERLEKVFQEKPKFFENIFVLAQVNQVYEELNNIKKRLHFESIFTASLKKIVTRLLELNDIDRAIEVTQEIRHGLTQEDCYNSIRKKMREIPDIDQRIKIANKIVPNSPTDKIYGLIIFENIIGELSEQGNTDRALELFTMLLSKNYPRSPVPFPIIKKLMEMNNVDKAIEVTNRIPDKTIKDSSLKLVVEKLLEKNDIEKATEVAFMIGNEAIKDSSLKLIVKKLLEKNDIEKALEMSLMIVDEAIKDSSLKLVALASLKSQNTNKALELASLILPIPSNLFPNVTISDLIKGRNADEERLLSVIPSHATKDSPLATILQTEKVDEIIESIVESVDVVLKNEIFALILLALVQNKNFDQAIKVASKLQPSFSPYSYVSESIEFLSISLLQNGYVSQAIHAANILSKS